MISPKNLKFQKSNSGASIAHLTSGIKTEQRDHRLLQRRMPGLLGLSVGLLLAGQAFAQENVVFYETEDPGEYKGLDLWGFDTAWLWDANVIRGVNFLGRERTDVIRFSFTGDTPLADTDGDGINDELTGSGLDEFNFRL